MSTSTPANKATKNLFSCAVLKLRPNEKEALACKAIILIELSRFEEATQHIDKHASSYKELSFEKVRVPHGRHVGQ